MRKREWTEGRRDVLIEHINGAVPFDPKGSPRSTIVRFLLGLGWLRLDRQLHPRKTLITDAGRAVLAAMLADWADALERARFLDQRSVLRAPPVRHLEAAE